ncbi:volume-regulated anion channel subunit LRRC8E isoform X2 [Betta splendens]|nr:volume-regulated anion channel subunit LRRC8E isoform X2 [Betta splendens]XP_029017051.1 volume-regulated anion channel subunit LRRC8E isoform X2 [Betta splendens]XP_029017059.1 volume-regulated anion channel subunit LRRC8E isoform X2 [Betta splendens]XP_029017068.1 volume-regulated anion channel subunit LRRC8E isoform X2 [Betta splendens]XP_029017077.1 volume-regulated anion channel subunit LRRC8E isoform X2 [Betta splendens]
MIPVGEFRHFGSEQNTKYRLLKPWWDVFSEYLCIAMLMIGVFGCTLQLTQEKIACLPTPFTSPTPAAIDCSYLRTYRENETGQRALSRPEEPVIQEAFGRSNKLDIHQYVFVNHYCYERFVHWYAKYFPYLVVIHSMIFMMASNFWFKFPGTSSKIDIFLTILGKCFDSPWTTRALSEVSEERREERLVTWRRTAASNGAAEPQEDEEEAAGAVSPLRSDPEKSYPELESALTALDKKEGEQAKALFEKVKKFRTHVEEADVLYFMYVLQTSLKVVKFLIIIVYTGVLVANIEIVVRCYVPPELTGFDIYCCNNNKAHLFSKLSYCYICLVGVYGLLCIYALYWLFHRPLKAYSFEHVRLETGIGDIPDVKNDFAFLLHLVDRYDALYSKRFAVFLSEVSESRLSQLNLNHEWSARKLRARLGRNARDKLELHLLTLPGLPDTVFDVPEVESLKLEQVKNVTIPPSVVRLTSLQELSLLYCPAKLQLPALVHFKEHLRVLHVSFERPEEVPVWMYVLHGLEELHLKGPLTNEASRSTTLDSLRELRALRVLSLHSGLTKIPPAIGDSAPRLQRLCVHNDGVKLQGFSGLKKLAGLESLALLGCGLERIPSAVFSLSNLQELDLKENKLATVEEILSLQHCRRLVTLRLWHNRITYVPDHISKLRSMERLDVSWNRLRKLPARLFYCTKLRHLDVSHNQLGCLPPEVGILQGLQFFSAAFNSLETLPEELFSCKRLTTLLLGNNCLSALSAKVANLTRLARLEIKGNRLGSLPPEIGNCSHLTRSGLVVEESLVDLLPAHVQRRLTND